MDKLIAQIKMQCIINKWGILCASIMPAIGIAVTLYITIVELFSRDVKASERPSAVAYLIGLAMFYFIISSNIGSTTGLQLGVRMGNTRRSWFIGNIVFNCLLCLIFSIVAIFALTIEHFIYKIVGTTQIIDSYYMIYFGKLTIVTAINIFMICFSLPLAAIGMLNFISGLLAIILKGRLIMITNVIIFATIYLLIIFTDFKVIIINFIVCNIGILFDLKLIIVGLAGFILSWPFLERVDINRLRFK